jgi:hypothetical protein
MSRATIQALSNDPPRLKGLLQHRETSYLDFVPLLYDESALLRLVVDCTMARAQYLLHPNSTITELTVLKLYGKSLSGLQAALRDSNRWFMPDVLCATQILALYEVRNPFYVTMKIANIYGLSCWIFHMQNGGCIILLVRLS